MPCMQNLISRNLFIVDEIADATSTAHLLIPSLDYS